MTPSPPTSNATLISLSKGQGMPVSHNFRHKQLRDCDMKCLIGELLTCIGRKPANLWASLCAEGNPSCPWRAFVLQVFHIRSCSLVPCFVAAPCMCPTPSFSCFPLYSNCELLYKAVALLPATHHMIIICTLYHIRLANEWSNLTFVSASLFCPPVSDTVTRSIADSSSPLPSSCDAEARSKTVLRHRTGHTPSPYKPRL